MKSIVKLFSAGALLLLASCGSKNGKYDATGTFEADEVIVSSLASGTILSLNIEEGSVLTKDSTVGQVDPTGLSLQKEEVEATIQSLGQQTASAEPQVKMLGDQLTVQQSKLSNLLHEKTRIENLLKQDAATGKQLDDINAAIDAATTTDFIYSEIFFVTYFLVAAQLFRSLLRFARNDAERIKHSIFILPTSRSSGAFKLTL